MDMDHKLAEGAGWQLFRDNLDASAICTASSKAITGSALGVLQCSTSIFRTWGNCAPFLQGQNQMALLPLKDECAS